MVSLLGRRLPMLATAPLLSRSGQQRQASWGRAVAGSGLAAERRAPRSAIWPQQTPYVSNTNTSSRFFAQGTCGDKLIVDGESFGIPPHLQTVAEVLVHHGFNLDPNWCYAGVCHKCAMDVELEGETANILVCQEPACHGMKLSMGGGGGGGGEGGGAKKPTLAQLTQKYMSQGLPPRQATEKAKKVFRGEEPDE